jgi:hypothetical protein
MSSSGQRTHLKLLTVGDFDPQTDHASLLRRRARLALDMRQNRIGFVIAGQF